MKILTDDEFFEGILGGIGSLAAIYFFQKQERKSGNLLIVLIISWAIYWYIRKIGMNIYKQQKKYSKIHNTNFSIDDGRKHGYIVIAAVVAFIYFFLLRNRIPIKKIMRFSRRDFFLVGLIILLGFFVYP
jgi:hypothetical protein